MAPEYLEDKKVIRLFGKPEIRTEIFLATGAGSDSADSVCKILFPDFTDTVTKIDQTPNFPNGVGNICLTK